MRSLRKTQVSSGKIYTSWVWNLLLSPLALVKRHDEWEPWLTLAALAQTDSTSNNHQALASLSQQRKATSGTWLTLQNPPLMISPCPNENKPHGKMKACLMAERRDVWNWYFYLRSHSSVMPSWSVEVLHYVVSESELHSVCESMTWHSCHNRLLNSVSRLTFSI